MSIADTPRPPVESLSFEEALDELEKLAVDMTSGSVSLRQSVEAYDRGAALLKHCRNELKSANETIDRLQKEAAENEAE